MRYIKFYGSTSYCGTDFESFETFPDGTEDSLLDEIAAEKGRENGEDYSYLHTGWEDEFESEEDEESYYEDCEANSSWEEYPDEATWRATQE